MGSTRPGLSDGELSRLRAREIGFVFQQFFLAEHVTVRENVADGSLYAGCPAAERFRRADEALEQVGLSDRAMQAHQALRWGAPAGGDRPGPGRPSGDRARRRTDGNLDSTTGASIMELIRELNAPARRSS